MDLCGQKSLHKSQFHIFDEKVIIQNKYWGFTIIIMNLASIVSFALFTLCICYVQVEILYKLQLLQVDMYKLQHVQNLDLSNLQLVQTPYLSDEQCILMNLYCKIHKINIPSS